MDKFSQKKRSEIMAKISRKETKPEILVRKYLFSRGFRYRKNVKTLPGKPDIVLPKYKTVIFVNGCFWHGHKNCKKAALLTTNFNFWKEKIDKNIIRDRKNIHDLKKMGYNVIVVWQCSLTVKKRDETLEKLKESLLSSISTIV